MIEKGERLKTQRELLAELGQRLAHYGFNPKPSGQDFYRKIPAGKWAFHISFIPHKTDFDLTAHVAVSIGQIEELVNKYDSKRTSSEKRDSMTLGGELGNLSTGYPVRWTVTDAADILGVCDEVMKAFEIIGLPFLQAHSDAVAVHDVLLSSASKDRHLAPILGPRYMRAVASAYVVGHTDEVGALVERYKAELLETEDLYLEDFRALSRSLLSGSSQAVPV